MRFVHFAHWTLEHSGGLGCLAFQNRYEYDTYVSVNMTLILMNQIWYISVSHCDARIFKAHL